MDFVHSLVRPAQDFTHSSGRFVKRCQKPNGREFSKLVIRTAGGIAIMGFVGYVVKLIFIPVNNFLLGAV